MFYIFCIFCIFYIFCIFHRFGYRASIQNEGLVRAIIELSSHACCDSRCFGVSRSCMRNRDLNGIEPGITDGLDLYDLGRALENVKRKRPQ